MSPGVPTYRTRILYVPQRPSLLPGTPREFVNLISSYKSRKRAPAEPKANPLANNNSSKLGAVFGPISISEQWGIDEDLWDRPWSSLSGGESQRIALAVAVGIPGAEILLLDGKLRDAVFTIITYDSQSLLPLWMWKQRHWSSLLYWTCCRMRK